MGSPGISLFLENIKIDRRKADPVYLQVVYQFIQAVQRRLLNDGDRLPGSRKLSEGLGIHRKTLIAALEELKLQGWIITKPAVGTFVRNPEAVISGQRGSSVPARGLEKAVYPFRKSFVLNSITEQNKSKHRFSDGKPDYRIIKPEELSRFYTSSFKRKSVLNKFSASSDFGNPFFKEQLSYYINLTNGFHVSKENLLTAGNSQLLLYILSQLLVQTEDKILVAEYSYPFSNMIFQRAGAQVCTVPVDKDGIQVNYIRENFSAGEIKLLSVNPRHQYPTTINLTEKRKHELIALAEEYRFIIIENGADNELTYEQSASSTLFKSDYHGRVIYMGSFGRFLPPGFRMDYVIGPKNLIEEAHKYLNVFREMDLVKEQALGYMISEGDIHRYRRKALKAYEERRNLFDKLLQDHLSDRVNYSKPRGGLAYWIELGQHIRLSKLMKTTAESGLFIPRICCYQNRKITALRLGFSDMNEEEMETRIALFSKCITECGGLKK